MCCFHCLFIPNKVQMYIACWWCNGFQPLINMLVYGSPGLRAIVDGRQHTHTELLFGCNVEAAVIEDSLI